MRPWPRLLLTFACALGAAPILAACQTLAPQFDEAIKVEAGVLRGARISWRSTTTQGPTMNGCLMSAYWTNFAQAGDPNGEGLGEWPALLADDTRIMEFSDAPPAQPLTRGDALMFLDSHFTQLRAASSATTR